MSTLTTHVDDYLRMRRALGFKLDREQRLLTQFAAYVQEAGASTVTSNLAIAWARQPVDAQPNQWAKRLGVVRRFAAWLRTVDPATEVPPPGVFPARRHARRTVEETVPAAIGSNGALACRNTSRPPLAGRPRCR